MSQIVFWLTKRLDEMTAAEWESLCDGCGLCCLHKLEDEDSGEVFYTDVACRLLDLDTGLCSNYLQRKQWVKDCIDLRHEDIAALQWLPSSCAYRLVYEGRDLPSWHPLIAGDRQAVMQSPASVVGRVVSECSVAEDDLEDRVIQWVN